MMQRLILTLMVCSLAGCLSAPEITPTRRYTVFPELRVSAVDKAQGLTLGIRPLTVARPYAALMAFTDVNHVLAYRDREEWAEAPGAIMTRALTDALIATKGFEDVGNAAEMARPDLMLTGELRKFHEKRGDGPSAAELEVRLELRQARGKTLIWSETLHAEIVMDNGSASALADAMVKAVTQISEDVADALTSLSAPR
jgi:ABC-type uncharacterized transport system auxiliary subunit